MRRNFPFSWLHPFQTLISQMIFVNQRHRFKLLSSFNNSRNDSAKKEGCYPRQTKPKRNEILDRKVITFKAYQIYRFYFQLLMQLVVAFHSQRHRNICWVVSSKLVGKSHLEASMWENHLDWSSKVSMSQKKSQWPLWHRHTETDARQVFLWRRRHTWTTSHWRVQTPAQKMESWRQEINLAVTSE